MKRWNDFAAKSEGQYIDSDMSGRCSTRAAMSVIAKELERNPQLESVLAGRKADLGIQMSMGQSLGRELAISQGISYGIGRGLGI